MNPIIRGMLARWHGESKMLNIPQIKAANTAIPDVEETAVASH